MTTDTTTTTTTTNNNNSTTQEGEEEQMKMKYYKEEGNKLKIQTLLSFHQTALFDPHWKLMGCGNGHERRLLEHFPQCHSIYDSLPSESRRIILDITQRMAGFRTS